MEYPRLGRRLGELQTNLACQRLLFPPGAWELRTGYWQLRARWWWLVQQQLMQAGKKWQQVLLRKVTMLVFAGARCRQTRQQ
jgi:hypothetical protein